MKGYQFLLESEFLNQVMGMATAHDELKYSIMHWLVNELRKDTEIKSLPIEIDVVKINFHGSVYPGIGVQYLNQKSGEQEISTDYGPQLEAKAEGIYKFRSFIYFFNYVYKNQKEIYQGLENYHSE